MDSFNANGIGKFLPERLTPRQCQVLALTAQGFSMKEVALILNISVKTVESHRLKLMDRLDLHNIPRLVHYAIRVGLIALQE
jgi:DNA-binding CsgD family transcriptional regulator